MMYSKVRSSLSLHSIKIPDFKSFEKNLITDILLFLAVSLDSRNRACSKHSNRCYFYKDLVDFKATNISAPTKALSL